MSTDSDTIGHYYTQHNIQTLLTQNKMKDNALIMGTQLIQLLRIELQSQRKIMENSFKSHQNQLKYKYEIEIDQLKSRIQFLQRQLQRLNGQEKIDSYRKIPKLKITRTSSSHSLDQTNDKQRIVSSRKISCHRQKSEKLFNQSNSKKNNKHFSIKKQFIEQFLIDLEESKNNFISNFQELLAKDSLHFHILQEQFNYRNHQAFSVINKIPNQYNTSYLQLQYQIKIQKYSTIIRRQQKIINQMKIYQNQLQQIIRLLIKSIQNSEQNVQSDQRKLKNSQSFNIQISIQKTQNSIIKYIKKYKNQQKQKKKLLVDQNCQLKQIMDGVVKLFKKQEQKYFNNLNPQYSRYLSRL